MFHSNPLRLFPIYMCSLFQIMHHAMHDIKSFQHNITCMCVRACVCFIGSCSAVTSASHPIQHCSVHWAWVWLLAEWGWTLTWEPVRSPGCREVGGDGMGILQLSERAMPWASKPSTGIVLQLHRGISKWDCAWQTGRANWQLSSSIQGWTI